MKIKTIKKLGFVLLCICYFWAIFYGYHLWPCIEIGEPSETWRWWFLPRLVTEIISFLFLFACTAAEIES